MAMMASTSADNETHSDTTIQQEREEKCLPPRKKHHLSVISTTLWFGNLSDEIQNYDIIKLCLAVGDVKTIDMKPSCNGAFVCMNNRKYAARVLRQYHGTQFMGQCLQLAWAPSKAMKDVAWKKYWDIDHGVSYIPWEKLGKDTDYDCWEDEGMIDKDSLPEWLIHHLKNLCELKRVKLNGGENISEREYIRREIVEGFLESLAFFHSASTSS